ncbi:TldD/PmbA family protein [Alphaproteobacteria bacterium GH1-50]|uniref:TldD/PmbA family protein n=1 Tax=Kangsaoukella pontilimi TaxID=2691042 RepID=A0A7C9MGB3_9RHOB|nr:metallopeptidase TldD-related protein [Kangsaoukella pontilimi]MXQ09432.1 TldD/PmbA family protein [Kangsaoukella pontilimi]
MTDLDRLTADLIDAALSKGADAADAVASAGTSLSIEVRDGALEHAERAEGIEIGIRVLIGKRQACVSASDTRPETLDEIAGRAIDMARIAPEDPHIGLADPDQIARDWDIAAFDLCDPSADPAPAELEDVARAAEASALSHEGISQVQSSAGYFSRSTIHLAASNGFSGGYQRTSHGASAVAITGEGTGMERDYYGESRIYRADLPDAETIGRIAAERTLARAGARRPKTGAYPVVYDERVASSLIGHLLQAANGGNIARGSSWLRNRLGDQVLPKGLSIIEDPHRARVGSSKPFDGEGLPTARRAIVEDGVLTGWTLDLATARKLGMTSTANAARGPSSPPSPSVSNIALTEGDMDRDGLLAEMGTGLLVTSLIGSSINATTGDYSRGASGFWVENGEIAYPVNECTIAGNLSDMLAGIVPANDARHWTSRVVPSLLVEGLTIAGE